MYLIINLFYIQSSFSQPGTGTYYNSVNPSNVSFITDIKSRIRSPYTRISYDQFDETNIANFASRDNGNGTRSVFCVYTGHEHIYSGAFTWGVMSREHTWAQSWMPSGGTGTDQYSDQHHLFPAHQNNANGRRSNHPFGIVANVTYQYLEGKVGTNTLGQIVYEPRDSDKGDAARALLYMSIRYDGIGSLTWNFNWLNNTLLPSLSEAPQDLNLLLDWCKQDPPDKWEIDRNNYIQSIQQNRNPFSDHPEYMNYISFVDLSTLNPVYSAEPTNYISSLSSVVSSNNIQLNWNDATGSQLPSGYLIVAFNKNNYIIPVDGSVYSDDINLSDGYAVVNIPYANVNNYTFNNLVQNTDYYFTVYSYNGTGAQINYKTNGTVYPQTNAHVSGILAAEPSNHITNFASGNNTANSIQTSWTDAVPGVQIPSGYLLVANNSNSFVPPSDGNSYTDDYNLADGYAVVNISYNAADNYTFSGLYSNTGYYFKIYSYNGSGTLINYKTDGSIPSANGSTTGASNNFAVSVLDNFNRPNNNVLGNTIAPNILLWQETETAAPTSISLSSNRLKSGSTTTGRDFAYVNAGSLNDYPSQYNTSASQLVWAVNMRQTRADPSGFDNSNYGIAFILGKSTTDITTGNGYAVILGQSGSSDGIRLAKFTGGTNTNSDFTNVISGGDYSNQYLSIKVTFNPAGNIWALYVDSSSSGFPQTDPANTATQIGTSADSSYTSSSLPYLGTLWNHATGAADSAVFDQINIPGIASTTLNLT
ncbi:MAG TPA: endonuclease, partial [Ignavibacteria bacterium]|nr:endonuclease [Ignavibacteria bacterium]